MSKKALTLFLVSMFVLSVGLTGCSGNTQPAGPAEAETIKVERKYTKEEESEEKEMIKLMKEYGFKDMAKALEKRDYEAMDEFMNNITDEDYQKMIDIMRISGYDYMANMMGSINREDMIQMHNAMGGSESCHGDSNNNMMVGF